MGKEHISLDCVYNVHSRWLKKHLNSLSGIYLTIRILNAIITNPIILNLTLFYTCKLHGPNFRVNSTPE